MVSGRPLGRVRADDSREGIHRAHAMLQRIEPTRTDEVCCAQHDHVRKCNLRRRLLAVEHLLIEVARVDHRHDAIDREPVPRPR